VVPLAVERLEAVEVGVERVGETADGADEEPRLDAVAVVGLDGPASLSNASRADEAPPMRRRGEAASDAPGIPERPPPTGEQSAAFCAVRVTSRP
jgi:hypothetical protein